jgi:hypothetical protein
MYICNSIVYARTYLFYSVHKKTNKQTSKSSVMIAEQVIILRGRKLRETKRTD